MFAIVVVQRKKAKRTKATKSFKAPVSAIMLEESVSSSSSSPPSVLLHLRVYQIVLLFSFKERTLSLSGVTATDELDISMPEASIGVHTQLSPGLVTLFKCRVPTLISHLGGHAIIK